MTNVTTLFQTYKEAGILDVYQHLYRATFNYLNTPDYGLRHVKGSTLTTDPDIGNWVGEELMKVIKESEDLDVICIDPYINTELWVIHGHDINLNGELFQFPTANAYSI